MASFDTAHLPLDALTLKFLLFIFSLSILLLSHINSSTFSIRENYVVKALLNRKEVTVGQTTLNVPDLV